MKTAIFIGGPLHRQEHVVSSDSFEYRVDEMVNLKDLGSYPTEPIELKTHVYRRMRDYPDVFIIEYQQHFQTN